MYGEIKLFNFFFYGLRITYTENHKVILFVVLTTLKIILSRINNFSHIINLFLVLVYFIVD